MTAWDASLLKSGIPQLWENGPLAPNIVRPSILSFVHRTAVRQQMTRRFWHQHVRPYPLLRSQFDDIVKSHPDGKESPAGRRYKRNCEIGCTLCLAAPFFWSTELRQAPVSQVGERLTGAAIRIDGQFENRNSLEIDFVILRLDGGAIGTEVPLLP